MKAIRYKTCHGEIITGKVLEENPAAYRIQQLDGRFIGYIFWVSRSAVIEEIQ